MSSIRIVNVGGGDTCLKIDLNNGVEISVAFDHGFDRTRTPSDIRIFNNHSITEEIVPVDGGFETIIAAYHKCCL
jgi:hypothetical protein